MTSKANNDTDAQLKRHINIFTFHQFLNWGNIGLTLVILVLLLEDRGFNLFEISALFAIYSASTFLLELPLGALSDQIGRKKTYMMAVLANVLGGLALLFALQYSIAVIAFILMGLSRALMSGSLDAWFYDRLKQLDDKIEDQPILAKVEMFAGLGVAIFAIIGGVIADIFKSDMQYLNLSQYDATVIASIVFSFILMLYTQIYVIEEKVAKQQGASHWQEFKQIIKDATQYALKHQMISALLLSSALFALALFTLETFWVLYVKPMIDGQFQTSYIGGLTFVYFFSMAMGANLSKFIVKYCKGEYAIALFVSCLLIAVAFIALGFQNNLISFSINLVILCLLIGATGSPFLSLYQKEIPSDQRSTLLSLQSLCDKIGGLIGMFILGYIAEQSSISVAWMCASGVILLAAINYYRIALIMRKNTPKSD